MTTLVHELPGRLRFRVPDLKGHPERADALVAAMLARSGVITAWASTLTGSLTVEHDGASDRRAALLATLGVTAPRHPAILDQMPRTAVMLVDALIQRLIEWALHVAVATLI